MPATNKFGKIAGPRVKPNTVGSAQIVDLQVNTADIAAKAVTAAKLGSDVAGSGLTGGNGSALAVAGVGIAHHADDDAHSIFIKAGEINIGTNNAVTVDLGSIDVKATLIGGYWTLKEALAGDDTSAEIMLGTATGGGSTIAGNLTITKANTGDGQSNSVGMMRAIIPNGTTSVDMAATTHLWLDCAAASSGRTAGKVAVVCILQKSA